MPISYFQLLVALAFAAVVAEPEAEANADAGYYGLGYYGYPYRYGYYGYPYRYGYYGHYLGKREAEADPSPYVYGTPRGFGYAR